MKPAPDLLVVVSLDFAPSLINLSSRSSPYAAGALITARRVQTGSYGVFITFARRASSSVFCWLSYNIIDVLVVLFSM